MTPVSSTKELSDNTPCLGVIVPVYNEAATISNIIKTVLAQPLVAEVIIVDDGSKDSTWNVLQLVAKQDVRIKLHRHEVNRGKGAALRTGFSLGTAPILMVQDGDLEYDPAEYPVLCRP